MPRLPLFCILLAALVLALAPSVRSQDAPPAAGAPVRAAAGGTRGPYEVAFTPNGRLALVTEFDAGTLAVIDTATGQVTRHLATGGEQPTGVAVTPDGTRALVTNSFSGSLALIDLGTGRADILALPGMPYDVVVSPDGATAYVSVSQLDQVAVVDLAARTVVARMPAGRRPRALDLTPDGKTLAAANQTEGSVTFFDTARRAVLGTGPSPAVNLRGMALYPEGRRAYAVGQRAQNERPTETAIGIWSNQAFHLRPNGGRNGEENIWLDFLGKDVADPDSVVFDPERRRVFITCSGGHSLNVLPLGGSGQPRVVRGIGAHPKGLAFTPNGGEVWVCCLLSNDIAVVDAATLEVKRRVSLGAPAAADPHLAGRFLFTTATFTRGGQFSCASCHPDGHTDGISWKFVHVPDGLGKEITRNVRSLRGHVSDTAPFRWTGRDPDLQTFIQEEVTGLLQAPKLEPESLAALVGYVESLRMPPNPHRRPDGSLTPAAERGQALFTGKAGCQQCHTGPKAGAQRKAWIGTTPEGLDLDVPHLAGVFDSYPYLHDGSAATLDEVFTKRNPKQLHGQAHTLTPEELSDLIQYVREL